MPLPTVSKEAIEVVLAQSKDDTYFFAALERMGEDNWFLAKAAENLMETLIERHGMDTALLVRDMIVLQYVCLENQYEAECLERELGL
mgnify:CR=1 FL=1